MPPLASVYLNISFKTDGILILAPSCGVLSPIHFPIRQSPSTPPFFLPRRSVLSSLWLCHPSITHSTFFCPLSLPVTYFADVRQFETLVYLISTNIYYAEPKENELIPDLDIKLTPGSGRRMTSHVVDCIAVKRIF